MRAPSAKNKGGRAGRGDENLRTMKEAQKSHYRVRIRKSIQEKEGLCEEFVRKKVR